LPINDGDSGQVLTTDGSGGLSWAAALTSSLTDGKILVGNGSNVAAEVTPSGGLTMTNAGVVTLTPATSSAAGSITREQNVAEGDMSSLSLTTWAGIDTAKWKCVQVGKRVDLWFRLEGAVAGTLTTFNVPFSGMSGLPTPAYFSTNGSSELGLVGTGFVSTGVAVDGAPLRVLLYRDGSGNPYIYGYCSSISAKLVLGHISYFVT
jgi:hypothetical protein